MGWGLGATFFFTIFLVITIPFFDDMNYDVTHEHCHHGQKREEHKPVDLRWVIHRQSIAPERPLSSINIYMLSFKQFLAEEKTKYSSLKRTEDEISDASTYDLWQPQRSKPDYHNTSGFPAFSHKYDRTVGDMSKLGFSYAVAAENETLRSPEREMAKVVQKEVRKGIPPVGAGQVESMKNRMEELSKLEPPSTNFKTFGDYRTEWWDWFGRGGMQSSGYDPDKFNVNDLEKIDADLKNKWDERNKFSSDKDELWRAGPQGREPLG